MGVSASVEEAKRASIPLAALPTEARNRALAAVAAGLDSRRTEILAANAEDLRRSASENLAAPLLKRLKFDDGKLDDAIRGIRSVIGLPDPVGRRLSATELAPGLDLYRVTCPIGVIGVIFESRPDALVQISTLCLKSGNAVLLKGGSEAACTNRILADAIHGAAVSAGAPAGWLQLMETRLDVAEMLRLDEYIDLVIPRGSNAFVRYIMDNSRIPVLGHADGICHVYVDEEADLAMSLDVCIDSKCQYVAVCNAAETLLVHAAVAADLLPPLAARLGELSVVLRGCERTRRIVAAEAATAEDWDTEHLDYILSVRVVDDLDAAIEHINRHGSGHTDAIVTANADTAGRFMDLVDSGNVFWNCSTRFSDGFRYGLGAEVGISTNKIHARGPVGLDGLVIYKWRLIGHGHTVAPFADGDQEFTHRPLDADG